MAATRHLAISIALASLAALPAEAFWWGPKKQTVKQEWYGDQWPFTVKQGKLYCLDVTVVDRLPQQAVLFEANGKTYALNGTARTAAKRDNKDWREIKEIWRVDPKSRPYVEAGHAPWFVSVSPLIKKGLELCP